MSHEPEPTGIRSPEHVAIVEVIDDMGRLVDRTSFETRDEAERHAKTMRASGHKVTISSLDPQPKSAI